MIAIGADHRGYKLKEEIKKYLDEKDIDYIDFGTDSEEIAHYPEIAKKVALEVQKDKDNKGILICGSGGGMAVVANKYKGIISERCDSEEEAKEAKEHNNMNVITLPADKIDISIAVAAIRAWLGAEFLNGRYLERQKMIKDIENENMK